MNKQKSDDPSLFGITKDKDIKRYLDLLSYGLSAEESAYVIKNHINEYTKYDLLYLTDKSSKDINSHIKNEFLQSIEYYKKELIEIQNKINSRYETAFNLGLNAEESEYYSKIKDIPQEMTRESILQVINDRKRDIKLYEERIQRELEEKKEEEQKRKIEIEEERIKKYNDRIKQKERKERIKSEKTTLMAGTDITIREYNSRKRRQDKYNKIAGDDLNNLKNFLAEQNISVTFLYEKINDIKAQNMINKAEENIFLLSKNSYLDILNYIEKNEDKNNIVIVPFLFTKGSGTLMWIAIK